MVIYTKTSGRIWWWYTPKLRGVYDGDIHQNFGAYMMVIYAKTSWRIWWWKTPKLHGGYDGDIRQNFRADMMAIYDKKLFWPLLINWVFCRPPEFPWINSLRTRNKVPIRNIFSEIFLDIKMLNTFFGFLNKVGALDSNQLNQIYHSSTNFVRWNFDIS